MTELLKLKRFEVLCSEKNCGRIHYNNTRHTSGLRSTLAQCSHGGLLFLLAMVHSDEPEYVRSVAALVSCFLLLHGHQNGFIEIFQTRIKQ